MRVVAEFLRPARLQREHQQGIGILLDIARELLGGGPVYPLAAVDREEVGYRSIEDQAIIEAARGRYQAATGGAK